MTTSVDSLKRYILKSTALCVVLLLLMAGCSKPPGREPRLYTVTGKTMGTAYTVKCYRKYHPDAEHVTRQGVELSLSIVDPTMSTYHDDSELSQFNQHAANTPFPLSPETAEVFRIALEVSEKSNGAFDCTVGPLVNAWGFGPDAANGFPDPVRLEALRETVGYDLLTLSEEGEITKTKDGVYCDLSAVAKGYAVDQIAATIDSWDIVGYMIEVGGEVRTKGLNEKGQSWRIGIEQPEALRGAVHKVVPLSGKSMATSGDYRNFFEENGTRYAHVIDPRTGRPVTHQLASVSVIHDSCAYADAWATALLVLGPEKGYEKAVEQGLAAYFIEYTGEGTFKEKATPGFPVG